MLTLPAEELELSKEYHQAVAMLHAQSIRSIYSKDRKQKARSECLAHLRASLCPTAPTVEQILLTERFGV
jgi:hypothetical protein